MKTAQHTPGPWNLAGYDIYCAIPGMRKKSTIAVICKQDEALHPGETEANARLIAAAPKLLSKAEQAASDIHDFRLDMQNGLDPDPERLNAIACSLEVAIAAAKGDQS